MPQESTSGASSSLSLGGDDHHPSSSSSSSSSSSASALSPNASFNTRLNAKAPEFVPSSSPSSLSKLLVLPTPGLVQVYRGSTSAFHLPIHGGHVALQCPHYYYGIGLLNRQLVASVQVPVEEDYHVPSSRKINGHSSEETTRKIINQVEYYFSDLNLATTDRLVRFINKDAEGYDGKKVGRQHPLTELDMEELKVVAENLPEDHCHQNLMKIFSSVGSVETIRTCQAQTSNNGASRSGKDDDMLFKVHAFVEYESAQLAEKAVAELNDKTNWRSGLRVRLMRHAAITVHVRGKKYGHESVANCEEDGTSTTSEQPHQPNHEKHLKDASQQSDGQSHEHAGEEHGHDHDREGGQKKDRSRGRVIIGRGGGGGGGGGGNYHHNNRASKPVDTDQPSIAKQLPPGPRMPNGNRGFSVGRGKTI